MTKTSNCKPIEGFEGYCEDLVHDAFGNGQPVEFGQVRYSQISHIERSVGLHCFGTSVVGSIGIWGGLVICHYNSQFLMR